MIHLLGLALFGSSSTLFGLLDKRRREQQQKQLPQVILDESAQLMALQEAEAKDADRAISYSSLSLVMAVGGHFLYAPLGVLSLIPLAYAVQPLFRTVMPYIKARQLHITQLDVVGVVVGVSSGIFILSSLATLLYLAGIRTLHKTRHQARHNLSSIFETQDRAVWVLREGVEVEVPLLHIERGDRLVLNTGEVVPVDGVVLEGMALVDQQALTGEAQPDEKVKGSRLFASTLVISGRVILEVEQTGRDTVANHIATALDSTEDYLAVLQTRSETLSNRSVVPTLGLAGAAAVLVSPYSGVVALSSNYSEVMRLTAPLTMLNYLQIAADHGLLIKDGRSLEQLLSIDTVVFDKTGTLTHEQPSVGQLYPVDGVSEEQLLSWIATAEYRQSHPIARAVLAEAKARQLELKTVDSAHYQVGFGLIVQEGSDQLWVGSRRFMLHEQVELPESLALIEQAAQEQGHSLLYCARNRQFVGMIELEPSLRPEAAEVIQRLQRRGLQVLILSGDHQKPVAQLAQQLGVDGFYAETLPEQKADVIDRLQQQGRKVCFIGDGINDSIALKKAAVSISLSDASHIARDTAQMVLLDQNLHQIERSFELAQQFARQRNYGMVLTAGASGLSMFGAIFMGLTITGTVSIYSFNAAAGFAMAMWPKWQEDWRRKAGSKPPVPQPQIPPL